MYEVITAVCVIFGTWGEPVSKCWMFEEVVEQQFDTYEDCLDFADYREHDLMQRVGAAYQRPPVVKTVCAYVGNG
jgi:hypothetical protein